MYENASDENEQREGVLRFIRQCRFLEKEPQLILNFLRNNKPCREKLEEFRSDDPLNREIDPNLHRLYAWVCLALEKILRFAEGLEQVFAENGKRSSISSDFIAGWQSDIEGFVEDIDRELGVKVFNHCFMKNKNGEVWIKTPDRAKDKNGDVWIPDRLINIKEGSLESISALIHSFCVNITTLNFPSSIEKREKESIDSNQAPNLQSNIIKRQKGPIDPNKIYESLNQIAEKIAKKISSTVVQAVERVIANKFYDNFRLALENYLKLDPSLVCSRPDERSVTQLNGLCSIIECAAYMSMSLALDNQPVKAGEGLVKYLAIGLFKDSIEFMLKEIFRNPIDSSDCFRLLVRQKLEARITLIQFPNSRDSATELKRLKEQMPWKEHLLPSSPDSREDQVLHVAHYILTRSSDPEQEDCSASEQGEGFERRIALSTRFDNLGQEDCSESEQGGWVQPVRSLVKAEAKDPRPLLRSVRIFTMFLGAAFIFNSIVLGWIFFQNFKSSLVLITGLVFTFIDSGAKLLEMAYAPTHFRKEHAKVDDLNRAIVADVTLSLLKCSTVIWGVIDLGLVLGKALSPMEFLILSITVISGILSLMPALLMKQNCKVGVDETSNGFLVTSAENLVCNRSTQSR